MNKHLLTWILLSGAALAFGQGQHRPFGSLTTLQGLSETSNPYVFRDTRGFLWVGSIDGLNRFDGRQVQVFKPDSNQLHSIRGKNIQSQFFEDKGGDIWFTTEKAINCYRAQTGNFEHFFVRNNQQNLLQDQTHYAFYFNPDDGALWMVVSDTLYQFDTRRPDAPGTTKMVAPLPRAPRCTFCKSGKEGHLLVSFWAYGPGFEVLTFDSLGTLAQRRTWFGEDQEMVCYKSVCGKNGAAWFATKKGLLAFDPKHPEGWRLHPAPLGENEVRSICWSDEQHLLLASSKGTVWSFNTQIPDFERQWPVFAKEDGATAQVKTKTVNSTSDGLAWCSESGKGVFYSKLAVPAFRNVLSKSHVNNFDFAQVFEDEAGQVWCPTFSDSTYVFRPSGDACARIKPPRAATLFRDAKAKTCLFSEAGSQAVNTHRPALAKPNKAVPGMLPTNGCVLQWAPDILLVGTAEGLFAVSEKVSASDTLRRSLYFAREGITALYKDKYSKLWAGTSDHLEVFEMAGDFSARSTARFERTGMVNHMAADLQNPALMWVGTASGLLQINTQTWEIRRIRDASGTEHYVQSLAPDSNGHVWLGTNKGIVRYAHDALPSEQFKRFDRRNGLSSNEYCRGAALRASNGLLWFAGRRGVDIFHPDSVHDIGSAPQLAIVGLQIHSKEWPDTTVCIEMAQRIQLDYNQNTLRLELAAMEYTDPEMNRFRVWLSKDGSKPDTVELGTQNFITYANLRPGHYRFEFTACNAEGIWQKTPRQLEIVIRPHFSETLWFRLLMAVLALAVIGFGTAFYYRYRLRVQQLELERQQREADRKQLLLENELALQQERNRIADEMHDELGGGLATIRLSSERARKMESPDELKTILSRVSQISIGLISNMRGIIWAMDTQNDSLDSLLSYLRQYARTFLDDNAIQSNIQMPTERLDLSLTGQYRHSILLTVKECLNNILKHAEASEVWLHAAADTELVIHIRDNGKGFDPEEKAGSGKGLRTTVKRMESVGGSIEWIRNPEGGMTTVLRAPLAAG